MTAAILLQIIQGLLGAAPELLTLYDSLKSGESVTPDQVTAILSKYGVDRLTLLSDIAAEKAAGN